MAEATAKKPSAFKRWTEKHKKLWQFIKFTLFSWCSGATQMITYMLLGSVILVPLSKVSFEWWIFHYSNAQTGLFNDFIAYFVSTTVGNMISFVLNREKTFKSVRNVTFSVTATLVMIVFIICYSSFFGPKLNVALGSLFPALNKTEGTVAVRNFIGSFLLSIITFFFVFLMDKFVILREGKNKNAKKAEDAAGTQNADAAEIDSAPAAGKKTRSKRLLITTIIFLACGALALLDGNFISAHGARLQTVAEVLIFGSAAFGTGEILFFAYLASASS